MPEPDGPVEVCLTIPAGQLERDVVVLLVTSDITATGLCLKLIGMYYIKAESVWRS